jgi:hypothetical protein
MAEFLGKPKIKKEDISSYMRNQKIIVEYFLDEMKPKIHFTVEPEVFSSLEKALIKKYGKFSPSLVRKAAYEALKEWIDRNG